MTKKSECKHVWRDGWKSNLIDGELPSIVLFCIHCDKEILLSSNAIQIGTDYENLSRSMTESIGSYLNGNINALSRFLFLARQRENLLKRKKNEDID